MSITEIRRYTPVGEPALVQEFAEWLRDQQPNDFFLVEEVDELLENFCELRGYYPPPRARARRLFSQIPGVVKERIRLGGSDTIGLKQRTGNKMERATVYYITAKGEVALPVKQETHGTGSLGVRKHVHEMTSGTCVYCKTPIDVNTMHIDHIVPRAHGGPDHVSNYVPSCGGCNQSKGSGHLIDFIRSGRSLAG